MLKSDFRFVIDTITGIITKRKYYSLIFEYDLQKLVIMENTIELNNNILSLYKSKIIDLISDLEEIIKIEMRYVLFPISEIKKEAYNIGKTRIKNFLGWAIENGNYTPEELMLIITEDLKNLKK